MTSGTPINDFGCQEVTEIRFQETAVMCDMTHPQDIAKARH